MGDLTSDIDEISIKEEIKQEPRYVEYDKATANSDHQRLVESVEEALCKNEEYIIKEENYCSPLQDAPMEHKWMKNEHSSSNEPLKLKSETDVFGQDSTEQVCCVCDFKSTSKSIYLQHVQSNHGKVYQAIVYTCEMCSLQCFNDVKDIKEHFDTHHQCKCKYNCVFCVEFLTEHLEEYQLHYLNFHANWEEEREQSTQIREMKATTKENPVTSKNGHEKYGNTLNWEENRDQPIHSREMQTTKKKNPSTSKNVLKTDVDFTKADSRNLPKVSADMVDKFYMDNLDHFRTERKNQKAGRSTKEAYGDNAFGYVQVQKKETYCLVRGKITPKPKISQTSYNVEVKVDEIDENIISAECKNCKGGCKHSVAFVFWLHRRTEEAARTTVTSYWRKSAPPQVVMPTMMDVGSIFNIAMPELPDPTEDFLGALREVEAGCISQVQKHEGKYDSICVYKMWFKYKDEKTDFSADHFLNFLSCSMTTELCNEATEETPEQSDSNLWYELRFGRVTANIVYECANCKTFDGGLLAKIMSSTKKSNAIKRRKLARSLSEVSMLKKIEITKTGIILNKQYPIFSASPDGVSQEYCIKIKCPSSVETEQKYFENDRIVPKYFYELQMQMFFTNKSKGLFCVASPYFDNDNTVRIFEVVFDQKKLNEILKNALNFFKLAIYPALHKIY